tara:strand:+ start:1120 stop:1296 length:177 start_codon:yes stop_codon:yes gene_type:complete
MHCKFLPDPRLGVFVCQMCFHQSKIWIERDCSGPIITAQQQRKQRKPCNCGKKRRKIK